MLCRASQPYSVMCLALHDKQWQLQGLQSHHSHPRVLHPQLQRWALVAAWASSPWLCFTLGMARWCRDELGLRPTELGSCVAIICSHPGALPAWWCSIPQLC